MRLPEGRTPTECHKRAGTELFRLYLLAHRGVLLPFRSPVDYGSKKASSKIPGDIIMELPKKIGGQTPAY